MIGPEPRVCIVGAGAVGGLLAARLAGTGARLTLVERGKRAEALRRRGLTLVEPDGAASTSRDFRVVEDGERIGAQDLVVLSVKAYDIAAVAPRLPSLYHDDTLVLTVQNGIPWWYFQRHPGPHAGRRLRSLDPDGVIEEHVEPRRIIGCVVYTAAEVVEPGVLRRVEGDRLPVGELDGTTSERLRRLADLLGRAGFRSRTLDDIRSEIWLKAIGSLSFNPISALTRATLVDICRCPETRELAAAMMEEARSVAGELGVTIRRSTERRIEGAEAVGPHRTSMLQDLEARRPLELEALVGAVLELAELTETPAPVIRSVYACTRLLDRVVTRGPEAARAGND